MRQVLPNQDTRNKTNLFSVTLNIKHQCNEKMISDEAR